MYIVADFSRRVIKNQEGEIRKKRVKRKSGRKNQKISRRNTVLGAIRGTNNRYQTPHIHLLLKINTKGIFPSTMPTCR
jgi:hypothetical protein